MEIAGPDRRLDEPVIRGVADVDVDVARVDVDVLVALDALDPQIAGRQPHVEIGSRGDLNRHVERTVARCVRGDVRLGAAHLGAGPDSRHLTAVPRAPFHPNVIVRAAGNPVVAGREVHAHAAVGNEIPIE